jgi:hypothetical protein
VMRDGAGGVCAAALKGRIGEKKAKSRKMRKKRAGWGRMVSFTWVPDLGLRGRQGE